MSAEDAPRPRRIRLTVYGEPAPQGSKRHVGGGRMIESSKKVAPWRQDVVAAARRLLDQSGGPPISGPVHVWVVFTLPAPKSLPKRRASLPAKKPDLDKLVRSTFDGLKTGGVWGDDAQAVSLAAVKTYPAGTPGARRGALQLPGAVIEVEELRP